MVDYWKNGKRVETAFFKEDSLVFHMVVSVYIKHRKTQYSVREPKKNHSKCFLTLIRFVVINRWHWKSKMRWMWHNSNKIFLMLQQEFSWFWSFFNLSWMCNNKNVLKKNLTPYWSQSKNSIDFEHHQGGCDTPKKCSCVKSLSISEQVEVGSFLNTKMDVAPKQKCPSKNSIDFDAKMFWTAHCY